MDSWLLSLLVCPKRKDLRLRLVTGTDLARFNGRVESGDVSDLAGRKLTNPLDAALVREDGGVLYRIVDGIPDLVIEDGIPLLPGEVSV